MQKDYTEGLAFMISYSFFGNIILLYALKIQWEIDTEYNIFTEILLVSISWTILSNMSLLNWIYGYKLKTHFETLNFGRWCDFCIICARSILCIMISTLKNIKDSSKERELILIPPDERSIESLD